ncbi:helix-turn-helix domain-containing protein [Glaciecola sp. KUL10]|jgi:transcriptional regulator with XRE-family HTH domain|uniref:helix-turn-helix domain-containing protein n=1 Tax=Glaciecola sp. (strain KUL10) TaxID=2161813 RepID=UPI000D78375B|nr:helix-turn-helix transcriptional regulator [Glaciecola sp. KUL10]GBL02882.1 DNA methyltransferase [Glaciecola sp. KUL10]
MNDLAAKVGAKIRTLRKEKGYSQERLALTAKLDRSYVGRIERGEVNITIETLFQLADTIGCDAKTLLP